MNVKTFPDFATAIDKTKQTIRDTSQLVHTRRWQGMEIAAKPEMATYEVLNYSFAVPVQTEDLQVLRDQIKPNIPWADDHFMERVGGQPLNPGVQWANWPYSKSADRFRDQGQFTHTYMERYWPKHAGMTSDGVVGNAHFPTNKGIRYNVGDLGDVINQLEREPDTRQAYLPVWFPEDTGGVHGGRLPCTLGYHMIMRNNFLHMNYYLRSCDFVRHFRDDIYLTTRLQLHVLDELRKRDAGWNDVKPGMYTMHMTSLHMFKADWAPQFGKPREERK